MPGIKIGIVEDEMVIAENLCTVLRSLGYQVCDPAGTYGEGLELARKEMPDLMILDINLGEGQDGIALAREIAAAAPIPFLFLTANADTATIARAKQAGPGAYLLKPFNKEELFASIEVCFHNFNHASRTAPEKRSAETIYIKEGSSFHKVRLADILYLESEHVYVVVHTVESRMLVRASMQDYLSNFDPQQFMRIHRSYAVNMSHLETINADHVLVRGKALPVSKNYRSALFRRAGLG